MDVRPVRQRHDRLAGIIVMMIAGDIDGERGSRFVRTVMTMHDPFRHRSKGHDRQQEQQHSTHHDGVVLWQAAESAKGWHDRPTMRRTSGKGNRGRERSPSARGPDHQPQQVFCCWIGGHGTLPQEQNTQQSPGLGRNNLPQPGQS